jgi:hypothetical protein
MSKFLTYEEALHKATGLLDCNLEALRRTSEVLPYATGYHFWHPVAHGSSLLMDLTGQFLLAPWGVDRDEFYQAFSAGERTLEVSSTNPNEL